MANYDGKYNDTINSQFNSLFGRDAADAGLNYWGEALSDPKSGITTQNLKTSLLKGASDADFDWYTANVATPKTNTPTTIYTDNTNEDSNTGTINTVDLSTADLTNPFSKSTTNISDSSVSLASVQSSKPDEADTVQGRMEGLLASGSPYIQAARTAGERAAHSRGLLNSSLAAGSAQKAAIEAALPIAQQDSQSMVDAWMAEQEQDNASDLSYQQYLQDSNKVLLEGQVNSTLSAQEHDQSMALDWQQQAGANYRKQLEATLSETLKTMELSSSEKTSLSDNITVLGEKFQNDVTGINADPNMSEDEKTAAILTAQDVYASNVQIVSGLYGVELTWDTVLTDATTNTTTSNTSSNSSTENNSTKTNSVSLQNAWNQV